MTEPLMADAPTGTRTGTGDATTSKVVAITVAEANPVILARGQTVTASAASNSRDIDKPAGVAEGDLLLLYVGVSNTTATVTPPAGFEPVEGGAITDSGLPIRTFWKVAGPSEPATYTVTFTGTPSTPVRWA
jgi:hypothetical protein